MKICSVRASHRSNSRPLLSILPELANGSSAASRPYANSSGGAKNVEPHWLCFLPNTLDRFVVAEGLDPPLEFAADGHSALPQTATKYPVHDVRSKMDYVKRQHR
jgi:hypothetical protein